MQRLLNFYIEALENTYQHETAEQIRALSAESMLAARFVKVVPQTLLGRANPGGGNGRRYGGVIKESLFIFEKRSFSNIKK